MYDLTVSVEEAERLLQPKDFQFLRKYYGDNLPNELANLPQPPIMGFNTSKDELKLLMLDHVLTKIGITRSK